MASITDSCGKCGGEFSIEGIPSDAALYAHRQWIDRHRYCQQKPTPLYREYDPNNPTAGCPCRPENGGSGICGCVLNNPVTC